MMYVRLIPAVLTQPYGFVPDLDQADVDADRSPINGSGATCSVFFTVPSLYLATSSRVLDWSKDDTVLLDHVSALLTDGLRIRCFKHSCDI